MASEKSDLLQGTLDMLVLKIVALEPAHGYGIAQRLKQISQSVVQVNQGSLYPALHRLEQRKWLQAEWKQSSPDLSAELERHFEHFALTRVPMEIPIKQWCLRTW